MVPDSQWCAWPSGGRHTNGPGQVVGLGRPLRGAGCETSRRAPAAGRRTTRAAAGPRRRPGDAAADRRTTRSPAAPLSPPPARGGGPATLLRAG